MSVNFKNKSSPAKRFVARRFCQAIGLSHRAPTHVAQKHPKQTEALAKAFIEMVRQRVLLMPPDAVANMDKTPIPFAFNSRRTLAWRGSSSIHVLAPGEKARATFNAAITLAGDKLKPLVIFKGQPGGRIQKKEFPTYSEEGFWEIQKNAWCDERIMLVWVFKVLAPWKKGLKEKYGPSIIPIIILDAYKVHLQTSVVNAIADLGIETIHIPAGCTYLCQPLDEGVNRLLKKNITKQWEAWMEEEGYSTLTKPSRKMMSEWIVTAWNEIEEETVRNSWRKKGFAWVL